MDNINMQKSNSLGIVLVLMAIIFFATGVVFYPYLPMQVISHWNVAGQPNGYMSRTGGAFTFPIIFAILAVIFFAIPRIDPRRNNIARFRNYYDDFVVAFAVLFYMLYLLTLLANIGLHFDISIAIIPPLAALFYVVGLILPHTKSNFTIGIRTPWTISSEKVWEKTNEAGGRAFRLVAIIGFLGIFLPSHIGIWLFVGLVLAAAIGLIIYSYVLYERERK